MAVGYRNAAGQDWDVLFSEDTVGDGPVAPGYRKSDGSSIKYAAIKYGSKGPDVGYRDSSGVDLSNYWAASGSAQYALPINGNSYTSNNQSRGRAQIRFQMNSNGTYQVLDWRSTSSQTVLASGNWLTDGSAASLWACNFDVTVTNASTIGSGVTGSDNTAPTSSQYSLGSGNYYAGAYAQADLTGSDASCNGTMVMHLYKNGVKVSDTTIYSNNNVNGN